MQKRAGNFLFYKNPIKPEITVAAFFCSLHLLISTNTKSPARKKKKK